MGVTQRSCGSEFERIQAALAECFSDKAAVGDGNGRYVWLADKPNLFHEKVKVEPCMDSDLYKRPYMLVICYRVIVSGELKKAHMQLVSSLSCGRNA